MYEVHLYSVKVVLQHSSYTYNGREYLSAIFHSAPIISPRLLQLCVLAGRISHRAECLARACAVVCLPAVFHTVPTVSPGLLLSYAFAGRISHRADCLAGACAVVCTCRAYVIPRRLSRQGFCSCVRRAMRLCPGQFSRLPADRRNLRYLSLLPKHLP